VILPAPDEAIWIGMLRLSLVIPSARSLKDKRQVVSRVRERLRARKNLSVAEVGHLESHSRAILAICLVSNDPRNVRSQLDALAHEIDRLVPDSVGGCTVSIFPPPDLDSV
jgi:uncharacterized protein YlxP (DUF503 family)